MVVSVLITRFELAVAAGGRAPLLGAPIALAPADHGDRRLGEASAAAEAQGVRSGMALGEALGRCPELVLIPPDPVGSRSEWERVLASLEGIGALVCSPAPGRALFEADGLLRMHGGINRLLAATSRAVGRPVKLGVAPGQFAAAVASTAARPRRPVIVGEGEEGARRFLAPHPVSLLDRDRRTAHLPPALERLGIDRFDHLSRMSPDDLADRFGKAGTIARDLSLGRDLKLVPRTVPVVVSESVGLPEAAQGPQLDHALDLLIRRLLANRERDGRTLRSVDLSAALASGGTWCRRVCFRESLADRERISLALSGSLDGLPSPARALRLSAVEFGPPTADQRSLIEEPASARIERLRQAILQTRAAAGPDSALRAIEVEPDSRLPERRTALVQFEVGG
ncbi:MAG: hypothetical protein WCO96_05960 [Actinomycetes bacterium]